MSRENDYTNWILRGRQRSAVAQVLRKPMTTSEICTAARGKAPRIQLRDVWHVMVEFKERNLVVCLNPRHVIGKLYALTKMGRQVVQQALGIIITPTVTGVDWRRYAQVVRAKARMVVLLELARMPTSVPTTATAIRKRLRDKHPMGLSPTLRVLKDLERLGLIRSRNTSVKGLPRTYKLTGSGATVVEQILK